MKRQRTAFSPPRSRAAGPWLRTAMLLCAGALLAVCTLFSPARAQGTGNPPPAVSLLEGEVLGRGFDPTKLYSGSEIDQVNTFNGNLSLTLPLGPAYTADGGFSYQFRLSYNSSAWDFQETYRPPNPFPGEPECNQVAMVAHPMPDANAGLGWKLSFGELYYPRSAWEELNVNRDVSRYLFVTPDGSRHHFQQQIHPDANDGDPSMLYTTDNSFLRLQLDHPSLGQATVESRDGRQYRFVSRSAAQTGDYARWKLEEIRDPFGNHLSFSDLLPGGGQTEFQVLTDSLGRQHEIRYSTHAADTGRHFRRVIQELWLAGVGGDKILHYRFHYGVEDLPAPAGHTADWDDLASPPLYTANADILQVPLLETVELPKVNDDPAWNFVYWTPSNPHPDPLPSNPGLPLPGPLAAAQHPTGGITEWRYQYYNFPSEPLGCGPSGPPLTATWGECRDLLGFTQSTLGVQRRRVSDDLPGISLDGTWFYHQQLVQSPHPASSCFPFRESRTTVFAPSKDATTYFYNVHLGGNAATASGESYRKPEYGLPLVKDEFVAGTPQLAGGKPLFLSTQSWDACTLPADWNSFSTGLEFTPDQAPTHCSLRRSDYVRYEDDELLAECSSPISGGGECFEINRRVVAEQSVWPNIGGTYLHTDYGGWDGLGHFTIETRLGSWWGHDAQTYPKSQLGQWKRRTEETTFAYGSGPVAPGAPPGNLPSKHSRWLLDLATRSSVEVTTGYLKANGQPGSEAQRTAVLRCYDLNTGALRGERRLAAVTTGPAANPGPSLADPAPGGDDLLRRFDYFANGNVKSDRRFGGDHQNLAGTGCGQPGSAVAEYRLDHSYLWGALKSTHIVDDATGQSLFQVVDHRQIEPKLGRVLESRDASGRKTTAQYDALGNLTRLAPPGVEPTTYAYRDFRSKTQRALVRIRRGDPVADGTQETVHFDGFGRVWKEDRLQPSGPPAQRITTYQARGLKDQVDVWHPADLSGTPTRTKYRYDVFGRPTRVRLFDGDQDPVLQEASYLGAHQRQSRTWVASSLAGGETITDSFFGYDPFGQLARVDEPSQMGAGADPVAGSTHLRTRYYRDAGGRLAVARMVGQNPRWFDYDGRGFLTMARFPELGAKIFYSDYDTLGNFSQRRIASGSQHRLDYRYDPLGRLVEVRDAVRGRPVEELFYADADHPAGAFGGFPLRAGTLYQARRHNWLPTDPALPPGPSNERDVVVTETHLYEGPGGRRSDTWVQTSLGQQWSRSVRHDPFGAVGEQRYPRCSALAICGELQDFGRSVLYSRHRGLLQEVGTEILANGSFGYQPLAAGITYHPNGLISQLQAGGVTWQQDLVPSGLPRVGRVRTTGASGSTPSPGGHSGDWDSGAFLYDRSGNVVAMGSDRFAYDKVQRLWQAQIDGLTVDYRYDPYGNLTTLERPGEAPVPLAVNALNNRLTSPVSSYDLTGAMTSFDGSTLYRDPVGMVRHLQGQGVNRSFVYGPGNERLLTLDHLGSGGQRQDAWALRNDGQQVLQNRRFDLAEGWVVEQDYIHRDGALLATVSRTEGDDEVRLFHLDHLGSPRLITDAAGTVQAYHEYLPFGWELTDPHLSTEPRRFTGHERDANFTDPSSPTARRDDLDYMHARYYSPWLGRFLSVDPAGADPERPQSWNRYGYVLNNGLGFTDPDGLTPQESTERTPEEHLHQSMIIVGSGVATVGSFVTVGAALGGGGSVGLGVIGAFGLGPSLYFLDQELTAAGYPDLVEWIVLPPLGGLLYTQDLYYELTAFDWVEDAVEELSRIQGKIDEIEGALRFRSAQVSAFQESDGDGNGKRKNRSGLRDPEIRKKIEDEHYELRRRLRELQEAKRRLTSQLSRPVPGGS